MAVVMWACCKISLPADSAASRTHLPPFRRCLLALMCLTFACEIGFKLATGTFIYLLNPCHVVTVAQVFIIGFVFEKSGSQKRPLCDRLPLIVIILDHHRRRHLSFGAVSKAMMDMALAHCIYVAPLLVVHIMVVCCVFVDLLVGSTTESTGGRRFPMANAFFKRRSAGLGLSHSQHQVGEYGTSSIPYWNRCRCLYDGGLCRFQLGSFQSRHLAGLPLRTVAVYRTVYSGESQQHALSRGLRPIPRTKLPRMGHRSPKSPHRSAGESVRSS